MHQRCRSVGPAVCGSRLEHTEVRYVGGLARLACLPHSRCTSSSSNGVTLISAKSRWYYRLETLYESYCSTTSFNNAFTHRRRSRGRERARGRSLPPVKILGESIPLQTTPKAPKCRLSLYFIINTYTSVDIVDLAVVFRLREHRDWLID